MKLGKCFIVIALLTALPAMAQEGMTRTILNRADLAGAPGMEVISSILEVKPGASMMGSSQRRRQSESVVIRAVSARDALKNAYCMLSFGCHNEWHLNDNQETQ